VRVHRLISIIFALLSGMLAAQTPQPGVVQPAVAVLDDPSQSYALYLPSQYTPEKRWPVLMAFDPGGNGAEAVKVFQQAAEKFGVIVAGSNNSRNFIDPTEAIRLFSNDVFSRYAIDQKRIYVTGLSGGARVAISIAIHCKGCVAGIIACGAGISKGSSLPAPEIADWFLVAGTEDFNFRELSQSFEDLKAHHAAAALTYFDGPHSWMPPQVAEEALAWMQLRAMSRGTLPQDKDFIASEYKRRLHDADLAREQRQFLDAEREYAQLVQDFHGLHETPEAEKLSQELTKSSELRKARKERNAALDLEDSIANRLNGTVQSFSEKQGPSGLLFEQLESQASEARRTEESSHDAERRHAVARAVGGAFIFAIESGQKDMLKKDYGSAKDFFTACTILKPESPWPHLLLARVHAAMNEKKGAIEELRRAAATGLSRSASLNDKAFDNLRSDASFQEIQKRVAAEESRKQN